MMALSLCVRNTIDRPCPGTKNYLNSSGWLVTNAGTPGCRRYEGGDEASCKTSADCRIPPMQSHYCKIPAGGGPGACVGGGGTVFDGPAVLRLYHTTFSEMQAGLLGGHLRVASVGAYDVGTGRGLEMMALGPLAIDNDTMLVAIKPYAAVNASVAADAADTATTNATTANADAGASKEPFAYYSVSLDRTHPQSSNPVPSATFYLAVLEHAVEWNAMFAPAMKVTLPYAERRQVDMAKGVLVSTSTVYTGNQPNYGTDTYWHGSPPAKAMMDTSGIGDSLPLTSLSFDTALLQWGVFGSALDKIGFYFDTFIFQNGTIDMGHWKDIWWVLRCDYDCTSVQHQCAGG